MYFFHNQHPATKICGIRNEEDLQTAIQAKAKAVGFIFQATSPDELEYDLLQELVAKTPPGVDTVVVTELGHLEQITKLINEVKPTLIQLHNQSCFRFLEEIKELNCGTIATIRPEYHINVRQLKTVNEHADAVLIDGGKKIRPITLLSSIKAIDESAKQLEIPIIIAGSLTPFNLQPLTELSLPIAAADVNRGVEDGYGAKSLEACQQFVDNARHLL